MVALQTIPAESNAEEILALIDCDGACILSDAMDSELFETTNKELAPFIANTEFGEDEFTGTKTQRTGALVARSPACRVVVQNENILNLATTFLRPFSRRIQLNTTQAIKISPGEGAQDLHRDRLTWGDQLPKEIETQLSTIWALTEFTETNGATRIVPGSHRWDWEREAQPHEICQAVMAPGSVLVFTGSVIHSGGQNRSDAPRLGLNITYCLGWLRQEENQYLSCPPDIAKNLNEDLQRLLGYARGDYSLGYYSEPRGAKPAGILSPQMSLVDGD